MGYLVMLFVGLFGGGACVYLALYKRRIELDEQKKKHDAKATRLLELLEELAARQSAFHQECAQLGDSQTLLKQSQAEFNAKAISYKELQDENVLVKRDLRNLDLNLHKLQLDRDALQQSQAANRQRCDELGTRYLKESVKWIAASINSNNFSTCKQRLLDVIERCRAIDFHIPAEEEASFVANLRKEYEMAVRAAFQREEQARIKAQIREEQKREKEIEKLKQLEAELERERAAIKDAFDAAFAAASGQYSEALESLRTKLAAADEAVENSRRAISQAQITKSGHVYVISNIGSFGEGVFKVGMTRRLEPQDRIDELGSASVPFPFDVHMKISTTDAPTLENALHRALFKRRINKANPRKEFFKTDIETICQIVKEHHGEVEFVADPEAEEYRQSLNMPEEDQNFIESVYDELDEDSHALAAE